MKRYFQVISKIVEKDLILELKSKEVINSMLVFSLLVVVIFSFIFEPGAEYKNEIAAGILWMAITFSGILGLNKSIINEINGGNLNALLLAPVDRSAVFFGKVLSNYLFLLLMELMTIPIFMIFYNINLFEKNVVGTLLVFLSGSYGFSVLGTLFSLISVKSKTRELMLPLLLLPLLVPVILASIQSLNIFYFDGGYADASKWLKLIFAFDIIFTCVIYVIFDYVVEE
ncbi:heme exporter membrane protein [Deferribacter desulfuricans SSM1]|uniref:Heme exporter protein B n=1 Tax=Deferribacter desulfuricans (strain DSM 14783 / JCM 11476 / NBRC 101012 / SSM1) TaxID=639282 RepID=D3PAR5_DEFDS|nr:heme exporter protein CcmB [Deferribacter desulfuricans]BAI79688.1 heme exporter membrane protein [Deferribacter desulfuricans SSM1]